MSRQVVAIKRIDPKFNLQQTVRGLRFVVHTNDVFGGGEVILNFDAVSVTANSTHTAFSWRYPNATDSFCQFCDLMVSMGCNSIDEMVGKKLIIKTHKDKTFLSADNIHWHIYQPGIKTGAGTGCVSGNQLPERQADQYLLS